MATKEYDIQKMEGGLMSVQDIVDKALIALHNGEKAICPLCGKGSFKPINGDAYTATVFTCDKCGKQLIIN